MDKAEEELKYYLDYNASTPLDKDVATTMISAIQHLGFCNPSSNHSLGHRAKDAIELARRQIASLINSSPQEIAFCSCSTESINMALKGVCNRYKRLNKGKVGHIITCVTEHVAVIETCNYLESEGFSVTYLTVNKNGELSIDELLSSITDQTILISLMHANNEVGCIHNICEISRRVKEKHKNIIIHTDASQSIGKAVVNVKELGVDLLSVAGHKLYAPKGVGCLYIKNGVELEKFMHGAGHEHNKRAGTESVISISALGKACEVAEKRLLKDIEKYEEMRTILLDEIKANYKYTLKVNGPVEAQLRLTNTLSISFENVKAYKLLKNLLPYGIFASAGSACHEKKDYEDNDDVKISSVLKAMKLPENFAIGTLRFSLGRYSSDENVKECGKIIADEANKLYECS